MGRIKPIRITKNDRAEYARLVKNTKAKIRRTDKNYGIDLSDQIELPPLESFQTRAEFNEWKEKQSSFTNRANLNFQFKKNEYNVVASKKRLNEIERNVKRAQELADKKIEQYENKPFISGGKEQGTVGMQRPNKTGIYRPNDFVFEDVRSQRRLDEIEETMWAKADPIYYDERNKRMQDNFITSLTGSFNTLADDLIDEIKKIHPDAFYQIYLMFDEFDFDYFDTEGNNVEADESSIGQMMKYIKRYQEGRLDDDLWHPNFN